MKTADFLRKHNACREVAKWALSVSPDMSAVWDVLVNQGKRSWLLWVVTRPGVFPDSTLRRLACRFVRETPVGGGRTAWDLLTDERSRKAVEVAERYADGNATEKELSAANAAASSVAAASCAAHIAARIAAHTAYSAAHISAADATAHIAAADAACYAAEAAAYTAQVRMIAELGNPFKKGSDK